MRSKLGRSYYMLVASLPAMPRHFDVRQTPISRVRLEGRLELLHEEDRQTVEQMQTFLLWDRQGTDRTEEQVIADFNRLMETTKNPLVRQMITFRMDVRTIVSGLRRRRLGFGPPLGVGAWVEEIRRNWDEPTFRIGNLLPWVEEVEGLMEQGDALRVEYCLLEVTWREWSRLAERFFFTFETVLLYLARWEIVNRWTRLNANRGRQRLDQFVQETLGEYANLDR